MDMGAFPSTVCCSDVTSTYQISAARDQERVLPADVSYGDVSYHDKSPTSNKENKFMPPKQAEGLAQRQADSGKKERTEQRVRSSNSLVDTKRSLVFGTGINAAANTGDLSNITPGIQNSFAFVKKNSTAAGVETTANLNSVQNSGIKAQGLSLSAGWCIAKSPLMLPIELPPVIKAMLDFRPPPIPAGLDLTSLCVRNIKKSVFFGEWKGDNHCSDCFGFLLSGDQQLLSVGVFDIQSRVSGMHCCMYFADGSFYIGGIKNGALEGWGEFSDPPPSHLLEQNMRGVISIQASPRPADLLSVKPKLKGPAAGKLPFGGYMGQWQENEHHGSGEEYKLEEFYYVGGFSRNLREGQGKLELASGETYVGLFVGGQFHGQGVYKWPDGRVYQGAWFQGSMHGKGQMNWPTKKVYTGDFVHDQKHGFGVMEWSSGAKYEGFWRQDKKHGQGTARKADGSFIKGTWEFGSFKEGNYAANRDPNDGSVIGAGDSVLKMGRTVSNLRSSEFDEEV